MGMRRGATEHWVNEGKCGSSIASHLITHHQHEIGIRENEDGTEFIQPDFVVDAFLEATEM